MALWPDSFRRRTAEHGFGVIHRRQARRSVVQFYFVQSNVLLPAVVEHGRAGRLVVDDVLRRLFE